MFDMRFDPLIKKGLQVTNVHNLVDKVWGDDRPARPSNKIMVWDTKFAGLDTQQKRAKVIEAMGDA
jgi:hypothetical protein